MEREVVRKILGVTDVKPYLQEFAKITLEDGSLHVVQRFTVGVGDRVLLLGGRVYKDVSPV